MAISRRAAAGRGDHGIDAARALISVAAHGATAMTAVADGLLGRVTALTAVSRGRHPVGPDGRYCGHACDRHSEIGVRSAVAGQNVQGECR
jgi:hypothetical protein